ncbi:MAG: hypothetical protein ACLQLT_06855 [Methylovirgula sp.]
MVQSWLDNGHLSLLGASIAGIFRDPFFSSFAAATSSNANAAR